MIFMFPGQGSQFVGMGKNLYDNFLLARSIFEEADEALGFNLSQIIFEGPADVLMLTENAQPALLVASIAAFRVFLSEVKGEINDFAQYVCGHSLGEYSAVCAAGGISLHDAVGLVRKRGLAMKEVAKDVKGGMLAVLKSDLKTVESIISNVKGFCEIANDNSTDQVVVSGSDDGLEEFMEHARGLGVKRMVKLQVSAPFHSSIMKSSAEVMREEFEKVVFHDLSVPLISNVSASSVKSSAEVKDLLVKQISSQVRWREVMLFAKAHAVKHYVEFGPGTVLANLAKKADEGSLVHNLHDANEVKCFANFIQGGV